MRRSSRLEEASPVLHIRGLSTGDFGEALPVLLVSEAAGLSPSTINHMIRHWQDEYRAWRKRPLVGKDYIYLWADGAHFRGKLQEGRLACLMIIEVLADGMKGVIVLEDGYRESQES